MGNLVGPDIDGNRVEEVARRLVVHLRGLDLATGERLPGERRLAALLNCSRNTVREALARLRDRGVVEVRPRSGTYEPVRSARPGAAAVDGLAALELVGPEVARLAAASFTDGDVERLQEITSDLSRALLHRDAVEVTRRFAGFYVELGRLAGNPYLHRLLLAVEADAGLIPDPGRIAQQRTVETFFTRHVDVLQGLRRGDAARVGKLAQRCIRAFACLVRLAPGAEEAPPGAGP